MKVVVMNVGGSPIRVIIDGNNVNDSVLEAGEEAALNADDQGGIELRELGGPQSAMSDGETAS